MDTLARVIDRRPPVSPDMSCAALAERFAAEHDAMVLAVLDGERPVGLVAREPFLARMQAARGADDARPVREVMDPDPLITSAGVTAAAFRDQALAERPAALLRGFIALENGRYAGVGTAVSLLAARRGRGREIREAVMAFGEQVTQELLRHISGLDDFADRLSRQPLTADAQAYVRAIGESGEDLRRLLEQVSELHRADIGLLTLSPQPRLLRETMDAVEARWSARAEAAGVMLLVSYDGEPGLAAEVDPERLAQLFDCLIARALNETRRGVVEASLRAAPGPQGLTLEGRVRDSGRALTSDQLAHVFDAMAFDGSAEMPARLAMALANRLVQAMNGVVRAEANAGAGVTITFDLIAPRAEASNEETPADAEAPRAAHILIVDDNATNRMVAEALCEMFDCTSEQAEDGIEALEAVKVRRFDLILMDIKMPRMDGVAATRAIRALPGPAASTPIIALTANADPDDVRGYIAAGMNDVVEKPIKPDKLLAALNGALPAQPESGEDKTAAA